MSAVEQVSDAKGEYESMRKNKDASAEWVAGLEDEATLAAYFKQFEATKRKLLRKQAKRISRGIGGPNGLKAPEDGPDVSTSEDDFDDEAGGGGSAVSKKKNKNKNKNKKKGSGDGGFFSKLTGLFGGGKKKANSPPQQHAPAAEKTKSGKGGKASKEKDEEEEEGVLASFLAPLKEVGSVLKNAFTAWLRLPLVLFTIAFLFLFFQHFLSFKSSQTYNHPNNEVSLWQYCRAGDLKGLLVAGRKWPAMLGGSLDGEGDDEDMFDDDYFEKQSDPRTANNTADLLGFTLFHLFASLGAIVLALKLGSAAKNFAAFVGVGCGVLAFIATLLDFYLASRACPFGANTSKPCDYPFGSHWALSCIKHIGMCAAICLASTVFDIAIKHARLHDPESLIKKKNINAPNSASSHTSAIVTGIPLALYFAFYVLSFYRGISTDNGSYAVTAVTAGTKATTTTATGVKGASKATSAKNAKTNPKEAKKEKKKDPFANAFKVGKKPVRETGKRKFTAANAEDEVEEIPPTFRENLAYYASLAQVFSFLLLILQMYSQKEIGVLDLSGTSTAAADSTGDGADADEKKKAQPTKEEKGDKGGSANSADGKKATTPSEEKKDGNNKASDAAHAQKKANHAAADGAKKESAASASAAAEKKKGNKK